MNKFDEMMVSMSAHDSEFEQGCKGSVGCEMNMFDEMMANTSAHDPEFEQGCNWSVGVK